MSLFSKNNIFFIALIYLFNISYQVETLGSESCDEILNNKVVEWSIQKIKDSNLAEFLNISCDEAKQMEKMAEDKILITSGRKRGKPLICISDEKDYPCKFIIGNIYPGIDSSEAIKQIYSFNPPQSSQLNETVERLFLNPSSLIQ